MQAMDRDGELVMAHEHEGNMVNEFDAGPDNTTITIGAPYRTAGGGIVTTRASSSGIVTKYRCSKCNWDEGRSFDKFCSGCGREIIK